MATGLAFGAAVVLAAVGCQVEPPGELDWRSEPRESRTPAPSKPEYPAKAKQDDYAGAVAFVEYYYELAEYGEQTGAWEPLKAVSAANCEGCSGFWRHDPDRDLNYDDVTLNPPSLNDLIDGIAQVNVVADDLHRKTMNGDLELTWVDTVKCTFEGGRWRVISVGAQKS